MPCRLHGGLADCHCYNWRRCRYYCCCCCCCSYYYYCYYYYYYYYTTPLREKVYS